MATIRHRLQREIFHPNNEKLLSMCHVEKLYKKKKTSFLCIVHGSASHDISIVLIKQNDKNFKRKNSWPLAELKVLDGKNEEVSNLELDFHFEKIYRWVTSNQHERKHFILELWKQCCKHLPKERPVFKNVPQILLIEDISTPESSGNTPIDMLENVDIVEEFQAITEKEEADLEKLMAGCEFAISNAEAFVDIVARDLSLLDGENVQCVLASEAQVEALMELMEAAIKEAEKIESGLDEYDKILGHVRDTMEKMETKNRVIEIANKNNQRLLGELEKIVVRKDYSKKSVRGQPSNEINYK